MESRLPRFPLRLAYRAIQAVPRRTGRWLSARMGAQKPIDPVEVGRPLEDTDVLFANRYRRFWPKMKAFAIPTVSRGRIRVNLIGRERSGLVPMERYDEICSELEELVRSCVDPRTGESILEAVIHPREGSVLDREETEDDLVIRWRGAPDSLVHPALGAIGPVPYARTGQHTDQGFAFISGPGIRAGDGGQHGVHDLAPTMLALMGHSPERLRGKSAIDVETPAS
jgi:predicted AlkP superfamily phosphohydrolase/phosphomutase